MVEGDDAVDRVACRQRVNAIEQGQRTGFLGGLPFQQEGAPGQDVRQPGNGEIAEREQAGLQVFLRLRLLVQHAQGVHAEHGDGGHGGIHQREPSLADQPRRRQRGQQQQAQAARHAAAGVGHRGHQHDVGENVQRKLHREGWPARAYADDEQRRRNQIGEGGNAEEHRVFRAERPVAGDEQGYDGQDCGNDQPVEVEVVERTPVRRMESRLAVA